MVEHSGTGGEELAVWDGARGSIPAVSVKIGGFVYPIHVSKRCVVCNSRARFEIEEGLILGRAYASIQRGLDECHTDPDSPDHIGVDQMRHHMKKHMGGVASVSRVIVEKRRQELGKAIEAAEGTLIDAYSVASEAMRLGFEQMLKYPANIDVDQMLTAAKLVADLERTASTNVNTEAQNQMLALLLSHVQRSMSDEQFAALSSNFKNDPLFIALSAKIRGEITETTGVSVDS